MLLIVLLFEAASSKMVDSQKYLIKNVFEQDKYFSFSENECNYVFSWIRNGWEDGAYCLQSGLLDATCTGKKLSNFFCESFRD